MLKVREKKLKDNFEWSGKILEYSARGVEKEVGKGKEEYCQAPLITQLSSINTNIHGYVVFAQAIFNSFGMEVEVLWLDSVWVGFCKTIARKGQRPRVFRAVA